ncbi:MAG TPA: hypothetical protein P5079_08220 [Elusimicrobiota bacterium]|nr:hypothetical protein [Elusimicrobiota bacterium]
MKRFSSVPFVVWIGSALLLLGAAQGLALRAPRAWPPFDRPVLEKYALSDMTGVLLGLRRAAADLAFIQMLQYYAGGHEEEHGEEDGHVHVGGEGSADLHPEIRLTVFPSLREYVLRIASLDPYFHYAYLFGAGALAFNLNRSDEAFDVLRRGLERDPAFWQFRLYVGAIAYRQSAQIEKVISLLEEALRYPDCPTMLQNILANIHVKIGNYQRAAEIYLLMARTSRDQSYAEQAQKKLLELRRRHGVVS